MALEREGFVDFRGMKVWYHVAGPLPTADGRPPILFLHGGPGGTSHCFEPFDALADSGRTIVRYDELGSGRSDRPADTSLWHQATFVELLAHMREELGLERVHLVGWSWGGMLIMEYFRTRPTGVASVVLTSAPPDSAEYVVDVNQQRLDIPGFALDAMRRYEARWSPPEPKPPGPTQPGPTDEVITKQAKAFQKLAKLGARRTFQRAAALLSRVRPRSPMLYTIASIPYIERHLLRVQPIPLPLAKMLMGTGGEVYETMWGPSEFMVAGTLADWSAYDVLPAIDVPPLVTCGRFDMVRPERAEATAALIPGSRLVIFEESGHSALFDEPERYVSVLTEFLDEVDAAQP
jgi:pimeloyl-ACP methyl ester carboxylesterase